MNKQPSVLLPVRRIIAIGDLHGDYGATILALRRAKVINSKNRWIGGNTVVIQTGDQIDRRARYEYSSDEDSEFKIMNLFDRLHKQAKLVGGGVYSLLGNHEIMNVFGRLDYVSFMGIKHFGNAKARIAQFRPGGKVAMKMSHTRNVIMKIGDIIFVHGGINPRIAERYKFSDINEMMRRYLMGDIRLQYNPEFRELFIDDNSLLWTRKYSDPRPDCRTLYKSLDILGAKFMVIGHSPQPEGINCKCKCKVWRIDTGMSEAFGKRKKQERIEVLEILNNGKKITVLN